MTYQNQKQIEIAPSILSADFSRLQQEVDRVGNAEVLHIDVMDGHFVPNITIGPVVIKNLKTRLLKEVHLMVEYPHQFIEPFANAGAQRIIFHAEAADDSSGLIRLIKEYRIAAGISINPDTALDAIATYLDKADMVLLMTVQPGFGGQEFKEDVLQKIRDLRKIYQKPIEVDGGINLKTAKLVVEAGANILVSGSYIFANKEGYEPAEVVEMLKKKVLS
jgi:ribulose-phosphate 3-epimerase